MARTTPSFFRRIGLAFSVLFNAERAAQLQRDEPEVEQPAADASIAPAAEPQPVIVRETTPEAALQLLGLLQREARFVDFVQEDVAAYSDADIGAAARVVHEGCCKVLGEHFSIEPVVPNPKAAASPWPKASTPAPCASPARWSASRPSPATSATAAGASPTPACRSSPTATTRA